jgi:hypothetical protein
MGLPKIIHTNCSKAFLPNPNNLITSVENRYHTHLTLFLYSACALSMEQDKLIVPYGSVHPRLCLENEGIRLEVHNTLFLRRE